MENCKTCKILIKRTRCPSGFTDKTYHTQSWDDLNCKSSNVVYGVGCLLCGLIHVGKTKGQLRNTMSGHSYEINHGSNQLLYQHFKLPDHSILSFKVRVLERIYHPTNNPSLSTPLRRQREEFWIRELGTAAPYGCNDKIDSVGNLTSPRCSSVNVMRLFGSSQRRKRSHGHRHYNLPNFHADVAFDTLLPYVQQQLGLHHIHTKLYQLPVTKLRSLQKEVLDTKHMFKILLNISWLLSFWMLLSLGCTSPFKQFLQKRLPLVIFWNLTSETRVLTSLTLAIS